MSLKTPAPESVRVITDFATITGNLAFLSQPDVQILALAYEIECQRHGGEWRLRRVPGHDAPALRPRATPRVDCKSGLNLKLIPISLGFDFNFVGIDSGDNLTFVYVFVRGSKGWEGCGGWVGPRGGES